MGQQSLFDDSSFRQPPQAATGHLFDPAPYSPAPSRPSTPGHVGRVTGGEQLKMFMTPREIHAGWQPLDADREDNDYGGGTFRGTYRSKSWDTGETRPKADQGSWDTREQRRDRGIHSGPGGADSGTIDRTRGGGKYRVYNRNQGGGMESDEDLWARKLEESQEFDRHGQHGYYGDAKADPLHGMHRSSSFSSSSSGDGNDGWGGGESLYDSIASQGVMGPIRLGSETGDMGKPQIVGGHHRLAAATEAAPDRLVPVLHDKNIWAARDQSASGGYPYS